MNKTDAQKLAERIERWQKSPMLFVLEMFDMDPPGGREGRSLDHWQVDALNSVLENQRMALAACKGPGKSTFLAWMAWWFLMCWVDSQGTAMSVTKDNLRDNLWKEIAIWYADAPLLQEFFSVGKTRIESRARGDTWFLSARSIPADADQQALNSSLAGLHAAVVYHLLDEVGDMPPGVAGAASGIFTVINQRGWNLAAGNRTTRSGLLYHIESEEAEDWWIKTITGDPDDEHRSQRIDVDNARREIKSKGRDHPWVMVNILGMYPPASESQRIDMNKVEEGQRRVVPLLTYRRDAIVWGVDPAYSNRSGADEASLARRQGNLARPILVWRGKDGPSLAIEVVKQVELAKKEKKYPHRIFVDKGGVGTSCFDHLILLGYGDIVVGVDFGGRADDHERFYDKRTEMWDRMADWIETTEACLPNDPVLKKELIAPHSGPAQRGSHTVFKLESKKDMKKRGIRSPNRADGLALTFAYPVITPEVEIEQEIRGIGAAKKALTEYSFYGG